MSGIIDKNDLFCLIYYLRIIYVYILIWKNKKDIFIVYYVLSIVIIYR